MTTDQIHAPWTSDQVTALNAFQHYGRMHPFTCGGLHESGQSPILVAAHSGWVCPDPQCTFRQDWAHTFMIERGAAAVPVPPPADQTALRDRIAEALEQADYRYDMRRGDLADAVMAVLPEQTDRAAVLTDRERAMLSFALEMAQEEIYARSLEFTDEDRAALETLRRVAAEEQPAKAQEADRPALRDQIAEALMRWAERNNSSQYASMRRPETVRQNAYGRADAVLAVLSAPATCGAREPEPRTGTSPCVLPAGHSGAKHQDKWTNQWPAAGEAPRG